MSQQIEQVPASGKVPLCIDGDLHVCGKLAVRFYTEIKTVISRWPSDDVVDEMNTTIHMQK